MKNKNSRIKAFFDFYGDGFPAQDNFLPLFRFF